MATFVLTFSVTLQVAAAIIALRLIRLTGERLAWGLIAGATMFMAVRRGVPLIRLIEGNPVFKPDMYAEIIGLAISLLMVVGMARIAPLFCSIKRSEAALQTSEEKFRNVFEAIPTPVFYKDTDGRYQGCNRAYEDIVGRTRHEVIGKTVFEMAPKEIADEYYRRDKELFDNPGTQTYEWKVETAAGEVREVIFSKATFTDTKGNVAGLIGAMLDITELKHTVEALRRSQRQQSDIIEFIPDATFVINNEGKVIAWNRALEEMTGISKAEMIGKGDFEYSLPLFGNRRPKLIDLVSCVEEKKMEYYDSVSTVGNTIVAETYAPQAYGGKGAYLWGVATALMDEQGNIAGAIESIRDITERKLAENALRASEERFAIFFRASPIGTSIVHLNDGRFVNINDAFLDLVGYTREEIIGKNNFEPRMWANLEDRAKITDTLREQGKIKDFETQYLRKSGEVRDVRVSAEIIELAGQEYVLCLARDISERKKAREEKEKIEAQLVQAQKMESIALLAGGVAHDFNNMLAVIIGHTELAFKKSESSQSVYSNLQEIHRAANRSADLTRQLLAFARRQTASPKVLNMNETVESMLKMVKRLIGEDIDLLWKPGAELWRIKIDPSQCDQILANVCVNARDAIADVGKITIETENVIFDETYCRNNAGFLPGEYVLLAVSDDGCGMDKEILVRLFEPFFTTKEREKGTGLGLATVHGIIKQNKGFINVYSEPGQGTTLKMYFPRTDDDFSKKPCFPREKKDVYGSETILLVEDETSILALGKTILEQHGYLVLTASSPTEALDLVASHPEPIHLLITDVVMPEMNGKVLFEKLLAHRPGTKCIYMSGYTANAIAHHGVLDEGIHFLQKPFSVKTLVEITREVLER